MTLIFVLIRNQRRLAAVGVFILTAMLVCAATTAMYSGEQDAQLIQRAAVIPRRLESLEETNQTETGGAPAPAGSITSVYNAMEVLPLEYERSHSYPSVREKMTARRFLLC